MFKNSRHDRTCKFHTVLLFILLAVTLSFIFGSPVNAQQTSGQILSPGDGESALTIIQGRVRITNPEPNAYYWITVRIGRLHWPKEPAITASSLDQNGEASFTAYEGGVTPRVQLALIQVNSERNAYFNQWLSKGHATGHYPGIPCDESQERRLDEITLNIIR